MNKKHLALLVLEILILSKNSTINYEFTELLNDFIYNKYESNEELFSIILDINTLKEYFKSYENKIHHQIVTLDTLLKLYCEYCKEDSYFKLVEEIEPNIAIKINDLAILFFNYYYEQLNIY